MRVNSKTSRTGSCPGFSRSPEHDSSVEISADDFLTVETTTKFLALVSLELLSSKNLTWLPGIRTPHFRVKSGEKSH